jgi:hypothetical protein
VKRAHDAGSDLDHAVTVEDLRRRARALLLGCRTPYDLGRQLIRS